MIKNIFKKINRISEDINKEELQKMLNENADIILLDVRSEQEFKEGHLQRAINIPIYELKYRVQKEIKNKNSIIVAYCQVGIRSKKAVKILKQMGYKNVYHLKSGIE